MAPRVARALLSDVMDTRFLRLWQGTGSAEATRAPSWVTVPLK
eukprot:CAMPEP_0171095732 /NCGR_PEP_ID=MMETSP0766_2-20121228/43344_1 /TAXON_ID=439317 /ORGANISM="Gambierdiscus australes, Strain CAWD 149" /LENGTH=42 /DNA_ID= /DNA_START= /DNA_END= /DNA_ORIENTATION=